MFNLSTFFIQTQQGYYDDEEDRQVITPDFDKPMNIKYMLNENDFFIKSDFIWGFLLTGYEYSYLTKDYRENLKSKWVKQPVNEDASNMFLRFDNLSVDEKLKFIIKQALPAVQSFEGSYGYHYKNSIYYFDSMKQRFDAFTKLLSDKNLTFATNDDGSVHLGYTISEKEIYTAIMDNINTITDQDVKDRATKELNRYYEVLHFSLTADSTIKDGVVLTSTIDMAAKLDNIPNPYKMQIGTIEAKATIKSASDNIGKVSFVDSDFPSHNVTDMEQINKDVLQAEIKYWTDQGYSVDENGNVDWSTGRKGY